MGAVNTTYTFTATDTITSTKMNNIIDQTTITDEAIIGTTLEVASGKLKVRAQGITSNEMATGSVTSNAILDGTIVNADINASAAIAGTKIAPNFGTQTVTAGSLTVNGSASSYTVANLENTSGVQVHLNANGNTEGNIRTVTNHPLTLSTNNTERMRITAAGNVGIGTSSPSYLLDVSGTGYPTVKVNSTYNTGGKTYSSLALGSFSGTNTGGDIGFVYDNGTPSNSFLHITPWGSGQGDSLRIAPNANIGIGKNPTTKLDVNGTVTATAFSGPLTGDVTGNVTGNVSGSSGSCTGNSATVTNGVYTNASNVLTGSLNFNNSGTNTISNGTGDSATLSTYNLAIKSHWGIGFPSYDNVNRIVFDTRSGGAQFSDTVTAPTFSGNATTATTASTVSNGAITAAKLDGAQSGSAPIFGVRAWVNFNGTSGSTAIRQQGNVSSVTRNALGRYTITFSTAMQDTNYAIVGFARDADNSGGNYFVSALSGDTKTTTQVQIEVNSTGGTVDSPEVNLMIVR